MKYALFGLIVSVPLLSGCTAGNLMVSKVNYQAIRTDYAQPSTIPADAKIVVEYFINTEGKIQPIVYNRTSEIMILDQTKSFVLMPDGSSISYYDPTVRSETTGTYNSTTTGSTFNLGGVAAALGIGGGLGALMGATTVGGSETNGIVRQNTVTITDQPLVNIGPMASIAMSKAYTIPYIGRTQVSDNQFVDIACKNSPLQFRICVTYSVDNGNTFEKLVTHFYVSSQLSEQVSQKNVSDAFYKIYAKKSDALAENLFMFTIPNNIQLKGTDVMGDFLTHDNVYDTYLRGSLVDYQ